jgi:hypothetical protein
MINDILYSLLIVILEVTVNNTWYKHYMDECKKMYVCLYVLSRYSCHWWQVRYVRYVLLVYHFDVIVLVVILSFLSSELMFLYLIRWDRQNMT